MLFFKQMAIIFVCLEIPLGNSYLRHIFYGTHPWNATIFGPCRPELVPVASFSAVRSWCGNGQIFLNFFQESFLLLLSSHPFHSNWPRKINLIIQFHRLADRSFLLLWIPLQAGLLPHHLGTHPRDFLLCCKFNLSQTEKIGNFVSKWFIESEIEWISFVRSVTLQNTELSINLTKKKL